MPPFRRLRHYAALLFAAAMLLPHPALAQGLPMPAPALTAAQVDAIVIETKRRVRYEDPRGQDWEQLDPVKLAQLLDMARFGTLERDVKSVLIEQAGAWDLMHFDKPSDIQAMWLRWFPQSGFDKHAVDTDRSLPQANGWYADQHWGPESGAMTALKNCLPHQAWYVHDEDPLVWVAFHDSLWDKEDGSCIRKQNEDGPGLANEAETPRGKASAAIISAKLGAYLLNHGCSGTGPDSCLPLLYLLNSLDPQHPQLAAIVRRIDAELAPDTVPAVPLSLLDGQPQRGSPEAVALVPVRKQAIRKLIFLSLKLPIVLRQGDAWPADEFARGMRSAFSLAQLVAQTGPMGFELPDFPWILPWLAVQAPALPAPARPMWTRLWADLGRTTAAAMPCEAPGLRLPKLPEPFWLAFGVASLQRDRNKCNILFNEGKASEYYVAAGGRAAALAPLLPLRPLLGMQLGMGLETDERLVDRLGAACPAHAMPAAQDPWKVCAAHRVRLAQEARLRQADERREGAAERQAAAAERKRLRAGGACGEATLALLAGFAGVEQFAPLPDDGQMVASACKRWTAHPAWSLAAVLYKSDEAGGYKRLTAIVDAGAARVVSAVQADVAADSGMDTASLAIDTGRYNLAPGALVFGVDVTNPYSPRLADAGAGRTRTLYVRDGDQLRPVLEDLAMARWTFARDGADGAAPRAQENVVLTLAATSSRSHGYADLRVHARRSIDNAPTAGGPPLTYLLHYDGARYPVGALEEALWKWQK